MTKRDFYQRVLLPQCGGQWFDYEGLIRDIYTVLLRPGDLAIDIGANVGVHTFQLAQAVYPNGRVMAFEAVEQLVKRMRKTGAAQYAHLAPVIQYHAVGLSDRNGSARFYFSPQEPGLSSLAERAWLPTGKKKLLNVPLRRLDDFMAKDGWPRVRFIKVDIEGGEFHALLGGEMTIRRWRPLIVFEHNEQSPADFGYEIADLLSFFERNGYRIFDLLGVPYGQAEDWREMMVWNFIAIPDGEEISAGTAFGTVRKTLSAAGIHYDLSLVG